MNVVVPGAWMSTEIPRLEFSREGITGLTLRGSIGALASESLAQAITSINTGNGCVDIYREREGRSFVA